MLVLARLKSTIIMLSFLLRIIDVYLFRLFSLDELKHLLQLLEINLRFTEKVARLKIVF